MCCIQIFDNFFVESIVEVVKFGVFWRWFVVYVEKFYS